MHDAWAANVCNLTLGRWMEKEDREIKVILDCIFELEASLGDPVSEIQQKNKEI